MRLNFLSLSNQSSNFHPGNNFRGTAWRFVLEGNSPGYPIGSKNSLFDRRTKRGPGEKPGAEWNKSDGWLAVQNHFNKVSLDVSEYPIPLSTNR